jgi:LuxR family maltose regulon positive regulatory protein
MVDARHGRDATARRRLNAVLDGRRPCRTTAIEITSWLLEADLTARIEPTRAHHAVVRALELAAPLRAVRQVASAPPRVRGLLVHGKGRFGHHDEFVGEVLAASHQADDALDHYPRGQTLTARELEVLRDLQSLQSVDEIAESQAVSVNTVKTHLKALYRKFEVGSRREAVERGRELGLL